MNETGFDRGHAPFLCDARRPEGDVTGTASSRANGRGGCRSARSSRQLTMVATGQLDTTRFVTYRFGPHEMVDAYDVFTRVGETRAIRVLLARE
jgi:threonine dehydrogenase-like Zn-dependent dehydrogenase